LGTPQGSGELRVWAAPLESEQRRRWWRARYLPTLQRLVDLDIDHVLVTHGQPAISDGKAALQRALESPLAAPEASSQTDFTPTLAAERRQLIELGPLRECRVGTAR
jgi:hypothetical protein